MSRIAVCFLLFVAPILALFLAWLGYVTINTNFNGLFLFVVGFGYAIGILFAAVIRKGQIWGGNATYTAEERGDRSFWFIAGGMSSVFYLSAIDYILFGGKSPEVGSWEIIGLCVAVIGILLVIWAQRTLIKSYSGHVSIKKEQALIQSGPYLLVRHPAYLGYFLMSGGIAIGYWSIVGIISTIIVLIPSIAYRINVEERLLSKHFGDEHRRYAKRTKRLIPFIW